MDDMFERTEQAVAFFKEKAMATGHVAEVTHDWVCNVTTIMKKTYRSEEFKDEYEIYDIESETYSAYPDTALGFELRCSSSSESSGTE